MVEEQTYKRNKLSEIYKNMAHVPTFYVSLSYRHKKINGYEQQDLSYRYPEFRETS